MSQRMWVPAAFLALALALSACSGPAAAKINPSSAAPRATTLPQAPVVNTGEGGGAEAALVTYADAAQGFAIGYPGPWTQDKSVTRGVKFAGGDDVMTLEFVKPSAGVTAMAYAQSDQATMTTAFPGFRQVNLAPSTEVKNAVVLGFQANGTSAVTGKPYVARGDRYYMPLADGRIAVLTVVGPTNLYDRESIRDIALTLKVTR